MRLVAAAAAAVPALGRSPLLLHHLHLKVLAAAETGTAAAAGAAAVVQQMSAPSTRAGAASADCASLQT